MQAPRLHPHDLEALAVLVVEKMTAQSSVVLTADQLAKRYRLSLSWVYANAEALGGTRLGTGRKSSWRFRSDEADALIRSRGELPRARKRAKAAA